MVSSINSINSSMMTSSVSSSTSNRLTEDTKKKLEALGVDTFKIKTESEGLSVLSQIKEAQAAQAVQQAQKPDSMPQMDNLREQIASLASKVGVSLSPDGSPSDAMIAISNAITVMRIQAANNVDKISKVDSCQAQYDAISSSLAVLESQKSSTQNQITGGMSAIANYNKIFFNLV